MVKCFHVLSFQQKKEFIEYLSTKIVPESKKTGSLLSNFKRTCENLKLVGDTLFYNKGGVFLEVLSPEENEKLQSILTRLHNPGHRGNLYFIFLIFKV